MQEASWNLTVTLGESVSLSGLQLPLFVSWENELSKVHWS